MQADKINTHRHLLYSAIALRYVQSSSCNIMTAIVAQFAPEVELKAHCSLLKVNLLLWTQCKNKSYSKTLAREYNGLHRSFQICASGWCDHGKQLEHQ